MDEFYERRIGKEQANLRNLRRLTRQQWPSSSDRCRAARQAKVRLFFLGAFSRGRGLQSAICIDLLVFRNPDSTCLMFFSTGRYSGACPLFSSQRPFSLCDPLHALRFSQR